jgi:hypothetical protein
MNIVEALGICGAFCGVIAAGFWACASKISWRVGRVGMALGHCNSPPGSYHGPSDLEAYLRRVSTLNWLAALFSAISMSLWAAQAIAPTLCALASH